MRGTPSRVRLAMLWGLTRSQGMKLAALRTPGDVQDFVTALKPNYEPNGDTAMGVVRTLTTKTAHCIEGAMVAAFALMLQGYPPLLLDLKAVDDDTDHVVAVFKQNGAWGAISKSNHIWLRYRDPVYRDMRELSMSYFHEFLKGDRKTLRSYARPLDLRRFDPEAWVTASDECWNIAQALDDQQHYDLFTPAQIKSIRARDKFEIKAGKMVERPKAS